MQLSPVADTELLSPLLYTELKALAARAMRAERDGHTLQTTALVNEACIRVFGQQHLDPTNRAQFLGIAAQMMRRVLVDHARRRAAAKRPS
ncbi:MAG: ECF-type sigma factor, partial [Dokdonella sp.]